MDKAEYAQLLKHDTSIKRLEKIVDVLVRRLQVVEKENQRLRHAVNRTDSSLNDYTRTHK